MSQSISSGGIVINSEGKVLLIDQGGSLSLPKGHVKDGEGLLDTAQREISEEAGVASLEYVMNLGNYRRDAIDDPNEQKNIFMFLFKATQNTLKSQDSDMKEAMWVDRSEVVHLLTDHKDKEFFKKVDPILEL